MHTEHPPEYPVVSCRNPSRNPNHPDDPKMGSFCTLYATLEQHVSHSITITTYEMLVTGYQWY